MTLNFPNGSRSYDERRNYIRFWGYDSAMEVPFFLEVNALFKLDPQTRELEAGYLEVFDTALDQIHEVARKVYAQARRGAYLLAAADF